MSYIKDKINMVPTKPGCYIWLKKKVSEDKPNQFEKTDVLYVGKAISLKSRLKNYQNSKDYKTKFLMQKAVDFAWIITESEENALLLENNLIKKYNPPYNIRLKDDKRYPYLCLTTSEKFPRLVISRRKNNLKNLYFGPFPDSGSARATRQLIHKVFPIRKRNIKLPAKNAIKPCLNYHIKRCWAPCNNKVNKDDYLVMINEIADFLRGHNGSVIKNLTKQMQQYSKNMEFEKAVRLRDLIHDVQNIVGSSNEVNQDISGLNFDVLGIHITKVEDLKEEIKNIQIFNFDEAQSGKTILGQIVLLKFRNGNLVNKHSYAMSEAVTSDVDLSKTQLIEDFFEGFFRDYYLNFRDIPGQIFLSQNFSTIKTWRKIFGNMTKSPIDINVLNTMAKGNELKEEKKLITESISNKKNLIQMALTNAKYTLRERILGEIMRTQKLGLRQIKVLLSLPTLPEVIECYDISNFQGQEAVGSGVMLKDGLPHKPGYRKYKIKTVHQSNDPAMMFEVLTRRFTRIYNGDTKAPDLMVIDGGRTQLNAVLKAKKELGGIVLKIPVVGLAKREEELYLENGKVINPDSDSPGMLILRRARDEAHRFAVSYHRNLRMKKNLVSTLNKIDGVGEKKLKIIQTYLKRINLSEVDTTTLEKMLIEQTNISSQIAKQVIEILNLT